MEQVIFYGLDVITGLVTIAVQYWFFMKISGNSCKKWMLLCGGVMSLILQIGLGYTGMDPTIKMIALFIFDTVIFTMIYRMKIWKAALYNVIYNAFMIICELIIVGLFMALNGSDSTADFMEMESVLYIATFMEQIVLFFMLLIFIHIFHKERLNYGKREFALLTVQTFSYIFAIVMLVEISSLSERAFNISTYWFSVMGIVCLICYFITFRITNQYFTSRKEREEYLTTKAYVDKQVEYYRAKLENDEKIRQMNHDINKHLNIIKMARTTEATTEYIDKLTDDYCEKDKFYDTGNEIIDVFLHEHEEKAKEEGITFNVKVEPGCLANYDTYNLCTIFGNCVDNMMEAVEDCSEERKIIFISILHKEGGTAILFENHYEGDRKEHNGKYRTTKNDSNKHGIGLRSVQQAVKKMQGTMEIKNQVSSKTFLLFIQINDKL